MSTDLFERDCTLKCRSRHHAALVLGCAAKGSNAEIRSYCNWLCHNFFTVTDDLGRNLLHLAASNGRWQIVEWLIEHCRCDVDVRDLESGWTALHRSFFYGQITAARILLNSEANIRMTDHEGLTPLDILTEDRPPYIEYNITYPQEVYVWGCNINYNLGLGNEQTRTHPELLESFRKGNVNIQQVAMCKFHTVFLSNDGRLFTCGHGHGGRLGQGSEVTALTPSPVRGLGNSSCQQVAAGQDHLVLLMQGGQIWTCGLNMYHQLGHNPPPERLVSPKPISLKFLKGKEVLGICAARFHSVFYTKDSVYTFGLNAGQLGHSKGTRTQLLPHQVSGIYNKDWEISHVAASDGATVCATNHGDVYVLHEFQHRKIASRQLEIRKLTVIGGQLDARCDIAGIREGGGFELRVLLLTKSGKLYLWRQSNPFLRRCLFTTSRQLSISDVYINHYSVAMVTDNNQGYIGTILPYQKKSTSGVALSSPTGAKLPKATNQLNVFLDRNDCDFIRAKRLSHVQRATLITSDSKGRNFAVLQTCPKVGLLDLPIVSESNIEKDFQRLLTEASTFDSVHDVIIKVGPKEYPAHKYILSCRSPYFKKVLPTLDCSMSEKPPVWVVENVVPEAFEQILTFLYSNTCDFLVESKEVKWMKETAVSNSVGKNSNKASVPKNKNGSKKKSKEKDERSDPVKCMRQASKKLNLNQLSKLLENTQLVDGRVHIPYSNKIPELIFDRSMLHEFRDVCLLSSDGTKFPCHKCVLVARSEYFHSMLASSCWIEKTQLESLSLPIPSKVLDMLLHYFYSNADYIYGIEDPELLCQLLAVADQLLIVHLKEMCEMALVSLLTLKNAPELLELASIYNAKQLKRSAMEFICINLAALIETKSLDVISNEVLDELSQLYRNFIRGIHRRVVKPGLGSPTREELQVIEKSFPVGEDVNIIRQKVDLVSLKSSENKMKNRQRTKSLSNKEPAEKETRCSSESPGKKEILGAVQQETRIASPVIEIPKEVPEDMSNKITCRKPGQRTLSCLKPDCVLSLNEIMANERQMTPLGKSKTSWSDKKRLPHLSQKQQKLLAAKHNDNVRTASSVEVDIPSPTVCPWGKINAVSSPPSSVWGSPSTKSGFQSPEINLCSLGSSSLRSNPSFGSPSCSRVPDPVPISLEQIQRDEEAKLSRAVMPKTKPLHIINIEDQAIEELLVMYKAANNPDERISVSRVLPDYVANPIWRKQTV